MLFSSDCGCLLLQSFTVKFCDNTLELLRVSQFLLCISDRDHMFQILLNEICQCIVVDQVGVSRNLLDINSSACNECCALSNIAHALIKLLHLGYLRSADRVEDLCLCRDNVRGDSAGVRDGAVDSRRVDHMLSHVVDTDIHDLNCIQGGTSKLRSSCRMGGNSVECEERAEVCEMMTALHNLVHGVRVPCDRDITVVEISVTDKICLAACVLLRRAAIVADRSAHMVLFHISF
ncbi:uncharacterized protein BN789_01828 [Clostridium sp. CAG:81]|nr:uncharacterized protein BN789_01828 [Clostridium sp. CAG:81]